MRLRGLTRLLSHHGPQSSGGAAGHVSSHARHSQSSAAARMHATAGGARMAPAMSLGPSSQIPSLPAGAAPDAAVASSSAVAAAVAGGVPGSSIPSPGGLAPERRSGSGAAVSSSGQGPGSSSQPRPHRHSPSPSGIPRPPQRGSENGSSGGTFGGAGSTGGGSGGGAGGAGAGGPLRASRSEPDFALPSPTGTGTGAGGLPLPIPGVRTPLSRGTSQSVRSSYAGGCDFPRCASFLLFVFCNC